MIWEIALTIILTVICTSGLFMWAEGEIDNQTFTIRMGSYLLVAFFAWQASGITT